MVQYAGVADVARMVARTGADAFLLGLVAAIEVDFRRWEAFEKTPRLASHSPAGVIELMPVSDGAHYAFKYVNGHPANTGAGLLTVTGLGV
ncbi:MAG: ornithine cyclodeaminase, partial [Janthinobacterium lividum]